MGMISLNARCREIMEMFLNSTSHISLQQVAEQLHISKRSIYYDLYRINDWLEYYGLDELEIVRGKGILLDEDQKRAIEEVLLEEKEEEEYIFSPTERIDIIICSII